MNIAFGTKTPALTGSQRGPAFPALELLPSHAARLLSLGRRQQLLLQVSEGQLWLTQDGRLDDQVLQAGQQALLQGPGHYRIGAFGSGRTRLKAQRIA